MEAYRYLAEIYDRMMDDVDYDAWAAYLHGQLQRCGAKHVYEAACGTGSLTQRLYDLGYDITAADISEAMLRVATEKARKSGREIRYVRQDLRRIEAARPMDAVLCACDGLNYVDMAGAEAFARSAYAALKPGGALLFDISTRHKLQSVMHGQVYFDDADDAACIWQNRFDEANGTLTMDVTLFVRRGELFERIGEQHVQYAHDTEALRRAMLSAGFAKADVFEAFTGNAATEQTQRAQFVCIL
jgi:2-polyprenyl-3-methyl-5-hydroxy-6-metoxy-1,4-benzoquinol methylase